MVFTIEKLKIFARMSQVEREKYGMTRRRRRPVGAHVGALTAVQLPLSVDLSRRARSPRTQPRTWFHRLVEGCINLPAPSLGRAKLRVRPVEVTVAVKLLSRLGAKRILTSRKVINDKKGLLLDLAAS